MRSTGNEWTYTSETPTVTGFAAVVAILVLSAGSGVVVFLGLGAVALAASWSVRAVLVGAGVAILAVWLGMTVQVWRLLTSRETAETTSSPATATAVQPATVTVEIADLDRQQMSFLDVPCTPAQLADLAHGLTLGRPFSEAEWCGAGRPFSKSDFRTLRSAMLDRRLLEWRNAAAPWQGCQLSLVGRHVFGRLSDVRTHAHAGADTGSRLLPDGR